MLWPCPCLCFGGRTRRRAETRRAHDIARMRASTSAARPRVLCAGKGRGEARHEPLRKETEGANRGSVEAGRFEEVREGKLALVSVPGDELETGRRRAEKSRRREEESGLSAGGAVAVVAEEVRVEEGGEDARGAAAAAAGDGGLGACTGAGVSISWAASNIHPPTRSRWSVLFRLISFEAVAVWRDVWQDGGRRSKDSPVTQSTSRASQQSQARQSGRETTSSEGGTRQRDKRLQLAVARQ